MSAAKGEWFVGVDWATEAHQLCVEDQDGQVILERIVPHTSTDLAALCDKLAELADGDPSGVHVAIEVSHGIVVETLLEREFRVFAINPKQLDRFRDRFSMSGAKDDRRDAHVLADSIRTDPQAFRPLEVDDPWIIELREWSRMWDELQRERNQLTNRFGEQLRRYFPQFLQLGDDLSAAWIVALWERVPSPQHARNIRPGQVRSILKAHRVRRIDARQVLEILRQPPMSVAPGTSEAVQAHIRLLCERLALLNDQRKTCRKHIESLPATMASGDEDPSGQKREQRDVEIVLSLPGVGPIVLAGLLAEAPRPLAQRDYHALRALSGVAPVTKRSGKRIRVIMRRSCNLRLRNMVYHWARVAAMRDTVTNAKYAALRARGHSHSRALRSIADRLLRMLCAMLRDQTTYRVPEPPTVITA